MRIHVGQLLWGELAVVNALQKTLEVQKVRVLQG